MMTIFIKRHKPNLPMPVRHGGWIDLHTAETVIIHKDEYKPISLGVSMKLPENHEALVVPRSSTFKNFGVLMVNNIGVIDNDYCGEDDIWHFPALGTWDVVIPAGTRICQFRILPVQPRIHFREVEVMTDPNRGGLGSTGRTSVEVPTC